MAVKSLDDSTSLPSAKLEQSKKSTSYFRPSSSYATQPESDPPRYVRNLSKIGIEAFKDITWLEVGLDHRTRYEFRSNDIRRTDLRLDQPFLLRTRAYLGIKEILDKMWLRNGSLLPHRQKMVSMNISAILAKKLITIHFHRIVRSDHIPYQ